MNTARPTPFRDFFRQPGTYVTLPQGPMHFIPNNYEVFEVFEGFTPILLSCHNLLILIMDVLKKEISTQQQQFRV